jgi:non-ribosomal peptide synthetase component F/acyl carrier protein
MAARAEAVEPALAAIWAEVLERDRVGPEEDFFELGGTSLLAMQIVGRASEAFGVDVALDALFEAPTVAGLAAQIEAAGTAAGKRNGDGRAGRPGAATTSRRPFWKKLGAATAPPSALSDLQASAWAVQRLQPTARPHVGDAFTLDGPLDVPALARALTELVARHDILRTSYPLKDHRPQPHVHAPQPVTLDPVTVPRGSRQATDAELSRQVDEALGTPFDYEAAPPLRIRLIRRNPLSHVLVLITHEIACDGAGYDALVQELSRLYNAFVAGEPSPLSAAPALQYAEAIRLQRQRRSERGCRHWANVLPELPLTIPLPFEAGGMPTPGGELSRATVRLPARLTEQLKGLARQAAATSFMLHLAALFAVLHRHTGEQRLLVTSPAANRTRAELEPVIGFFARILPLSVDLADDPTFRTVLQRTRESTLQAFAHAEDLPEDNRIRALNGVRGLTGCGVVFRLWDATLERRPELAGIRVQPFQEAGEGGHLGLIVTERPGAETVVDLSSDAPPLDQRAIDAMLGHYVRVLEQAAEDPDRRMSELELLGEGERPRPRARGAEHDERRLHELVEAQARHDPGAVAVRAAGGEELTYAELWERATRLAAFLRARGIAPGARVGLALPPSPELLVALLATLQTGALGVPADALAVAPALDALLLDPSRPAPIPGGSTPQASLTIDLAAERDAIAAAPPADDTDQPAPDDPALLIATAGVSGPPRAVALTHRALVRATTARQHAYRLTPGDRMLAVPGPGVRSWALAPWAALASGGQLVIPGHVPDAHGPGAAAWLEGQDVTVALLPPALASSYLAGPGIQRSPVRTLVAQGHGTLTLPPDLRRGRPALIREYAVAEAGGIAIAAPVAASAGAWDPLAGEPASGLQAHVLDRHGNAVPIGAVGELWIEGTGIERTGTGDLARRRFDGTIEVFGRAHDEIRFKGFRLNPIIHDLEAALAAHPGVAAAAATWDPGSESLTAHLVPRRAQPPDPRELDRWLQERMRDWVLPARYVVLDAVPLRADGTPDRAALAARTGGTPLGEDPGRGPQSRTEKKLVAIWKRVLDRRDVGVRESFFAIGGDLARGVEMLERARAEGIALEPPDLMLRPTIAELAQLAEAR